MVTVGAGPAFIAGIASFLSPCVLPLVPGYVSLMSGLSLEELAKGGDRKSVALKAGTSSICFVLGFSVVFTALGASASAVGTLLTSHMAVLSKAAGVLIVIFGLHISGLMRIPWLYYEKRANIGAISSGYIGSFLMGLAFAFGWTPCIGPILAAILALAATQGTIGKGMTLLFIYSLGLGIPFILTGFGVNAFLQFFNRYKRFIGWGEAFAGALLIVIGGLVFFNRLTWLVTLFPRSLFKFAL